MESMGSCILIGLHNSLGVVDLQRGRKKEKDRDTDYEGINLQPIYAYT